MKTTNDVITANGWVKFTKTYADFQPDGDTSNTITIGSLPAGAVVTGIKVKHSTSFTGGTLAAASISVSPYIPIGVDVFSAPSATGGSLTNGLSGTILSHTAPTDITLTLTVTGGVIDDLTAGVIEVWFKYEVVT